MDFENAKVKAAVIIDIVNKHKIVVGILLLVAVVIVVVAAG